VRLVTEYRPQVSPAAVALCIHASCAVTSRKYMPAGIYSCRCAVTGHKHLPAVLAVALCMYAR
jgi:hypothetical protein